MTRTMKAGKCWSLVCLLGLGISACNGIGDDEGGRPIEVEGTQSGLILSIHNGADDVWTAADRVALTYCVSNAGTFGFSDQYLRAVHEMYQATQAWEQTAYVKFSHKAEADADCAAESPVSFAVLRDPGRGADDIAGAQSFPPSAHYDPASSEVDTELYIGFGYDNLDRRVDKRTTQGTFIHELGHILGFRHEHIRPEATKAPYNYDCLTESDGDPWRTIAGYTKYDPNSVMHYGMDGCGPLKDYAMDATDRGAAAVVYPAPRRCEVWNGSSKLGQTTIATPTSAADAENKCKSYATSTYQKNGRLFATVERHSDHLRAIMISSNAKACAFADSILLFCPGVGFRRPAEVLNYEVRMGKVAFSPANSNVDGRLLVTYGTEGGQQLGYLYDKVSGFMKNGLSKNVSFCGNDDSTIWEIVRGSNIPFYAYTPQDGFVQGVLQPLSYGSYSLSIDGMGGDDQFYGGDGNDVFTDLTGNNSAYGYGGNDTLRLCNYDVIDCGSGSGDKAYTCKSDTSGTITGCETHSTF